MKYEEILSKLCDTIDATGGVVRDEPNYFAPLADEDWVDLGEVYMAACAILNREPVVEVRCAPCESSDKAQDTGLRDGS